MTVFAIKVNSFIIPCCYSRRLLPSAIAIREELLMIIVVIMIVILTTVLYFIGPGQESALGLLLEDLAYK